MADHRQLRPMLLEAGKGVFAVIDGAQFDDLPVALFGRHFVHEPLYTNRGNLTPDQVKTAPQLVWLDRDRKSECYEPSAENFPIDEQILDRLFDLVEDRPAVVFWQCEAGAEVLYKHLRTINMVLYATEQRSQNGQPLEELVVFRHADSNVMAQVAMAMNWSGLSRLLGPADAITCGADQDWTDQPIYVGRKFEMVKHELGPMRMGENEIQKLEMIRFNRLKRRTVRYLRTYAGRQTCNISDDALLSRVDSGINYAKSLGVTEESAFRKWCYLSIICKRKIEELNEFKVIDASFSADEKVHELLRLLITTAEATH